MEKNIIAPVYSQIALDIAVRITKGELKENTKLHGRSILSSEYGVSPETIRRAMKLLEDVNVVETKQNSGSIIVSTENAKKYVEKFNIHNDIRTYQRKLQKLLSDQESLSRQINEVAGSIVRINEKFSQSMPFSYYETNVPENSPLIGQTLGESMFWQHTSATIIAIRRGENIILSPGPYAVFLADDTIIFVGDIKCVETVTSFISR